MFARDSQETEGVCRKFACSSCLCYIKPSHNFLEKSYHHASFLVVNPRDKNKVESGSNRSLNLLEK